MTPDPQPPTPVSYEPPSPGITRGSFRLLLLLTLTNTVLLGTYVLGPGLGTFARQQWADYQHRQADRKLQARQAIVRRAYLPAQQQCLDYLAPPGTLLYAEDADGVRRLGTAATVSRVCRVESTNRPPALATVPVAAADPPCTATMPATVDLNGTAVTAPWQKGTEAVLYLHRCLTPAGPRLVVVAVSSLQGCDLSSHTNDYQTWNRALQTTRTLSGWVLRPATADADLEELSNAPLSLSAGASLVTAAGPTGHERVTVDYAGQLRLFAGQPDAADPARFHIPYTFDGVPGTIDGRLTVDDQLRLTPDRPLADAEARDAEHPFVVPSPDVRRATGQPR